MQPSFTSLRGALARCALFAAAGALPTSAQCLVAELVPPRAGEDDAFGSAVGLSGDLLVVGARLDDSAGVNSGALYVFERANGTWQQTDKLTVPGTVWLGVDLAVSGERILAGATIGVGAGGNARAVLFERVGGSWTIAAEFAPPDPQTDDGFGLCVALAGEVAVVGRPYAQFPGPGQARVYEPLGGVWTETALVSGGFLTASAVATDGERVLVAQGLGAGVYERSGSTWALADELDPTPGDVGSFLNKDLAIAGDLAFVPAEQTDIVASLHVFERKPAGWEQTEILISDPLFESTYFGNTLSYSPEAEVLLVGSPLYGNAVHGYLRRGADWIELFDLRDATTGFGWGSAIDGLRLATAQDGIDLLSVPSEAFVYELGLGLSLFGCPQSVSLNAGGAQALQLNAGAEHAGALYLLLGSASGTAPGLPHGNFVLPLNLDAYLLFTLGNPNAAPLAHSLGVLGANGKAQAQWSLPPGADPSLAGILLHHAYALIELPSLALDFVSVPAPLALVP